jgi:hypothetical protein
MKKILTIAIAIFVSIIVITAFTRFARAENAQIWTDKPDYSPGETVIIRGSGFLNDTEITGTVIRPTTPETVDAWANVSDSDGDFVYEYQLDGIIGAYTVTATDEAGNTATITFTDTPVQLTIASTTGGTVDWSYNVGSNTYSGTVSAGSSTTLGPLPANTEVSLTANPSTGYTLDHWSGDLSGNTSPTSITIGPNQQKSVTANFVIQTFTITPSVSAADHGSISPSTAQTVNYGDTPKFTFAPDTGYHVDDVKVDGSSVSWDTGDNSYTFSAVDDDHTIEVSFAINFQNLVVSGYKNDTSGNALSGWTINLYKDNVFVTSTTTAASTGYYSFTITEAGSYSVNETLMARWTMINPKLVVGDTSIDKIVDGYSFTAVSGQDVTGENFTNFEWATVSGHKYEYGKSGLSGWTVKLYNKTSGLVYDTTTTGAGGTYSFTVKDPGTYTLNETLKAGWTALDPTYKVGDDSIDVEVDGYSFTVSSGVPVSNEDFTNFEWVKISGYKYEDTDGSKPTTHPLENWQIQLWKGPIWLGPFSEHIGNALTDVNGYYEFNVTFPGYYGIGEVIKPGWTMTGPHTMVGDDTVTILELGYGPFEVTSGDDVTGLNFWNFKWLTISGTKYEQVFCDNFESGDATGWTEVAGAWSVINDGPSNHVYYESSGLQNTFSFVTLSGSWDDFFMKVSMMEKVDHGYDTMNIVFRETSSGQFYIFSFRPQEGTIKFYKKTGVDGPFGSSGWTQWQQLSSAPFTFTLNTWYTVTLKVQGDTFTGTVGSTTITATDSDYASGTIGLMTNEADAYFDNVCIKTPLPSWEMNAYSGSTFYDSATTDSNGFYAITIKDLGTYSIKEVLPTGWTMTCPVYQVGPNSGTAKVTGYSGIVVTSGTDVTSKDFTNFKWLTISGYKFFDANGNGLKDPGEPGLQNWVIKLDKGSTQYLSPVTTGANGYYKFTIKDPGTYTVFETQKSPMWIATTPPSGTFTFMAQSGTDEIVDFGNWLGSSSFVTTSDLCYFDVDDNPTNERQFKLIFTPDVPTNPNLYRLTASNPGQFYYNIFYVGTLSTGNSFTIELPYPFVTQGANPVHVYSSLNTGPCGCLIPQGEISGKFSVFKTTVTIFDYTDTNGDGKIGFGDTVTITVTYTDTASYTGFAYINVHMDYGLKKLAGGLSKDINNGAYNDTITIKNNDDYVFSVSGSVYSSDTVENLNVFKRDPGFVGLVAQADGTPVPNVAVKIYGPDGKLLTTVYTDKDGWYFYNYKYTGKAATFTIKLPAYSKSTSVTIKSNSMTLTNFVLS